VPRKRMNRTGPRAVPPVSARAVPRVAPRSVPALVGASRVVVLSVGFFAPPDWDLVLRYIQEVHQGVVGWVDINEINLADNATRSWIDTQHAQMGRPAGASVRLGYYLFLDGRVSAYSSGLIDFKRDKVSLGVGIAAAIAAMYWRSTALGRGAMPCRELPSFSSRPPVLRSSDYGPAAARDAPGATAATGRHQRNRARV
jgi:hypothetical protein